MDIVDELNAFQDALGRPPEFNDTTDLPMRAAQEITKLRTKLAEREWQPIETAPKTGRQAILLWGSNYNEPQKAYSDTWWTSGFSVENKPSHWQLYPSAPNHE